MANRYVFSASTGLVAAIASAAPGAATYEGRGVVVAVVPDASVAAFDAALPAMPVITEAVPEGSSATLNVLAPDHLLEGLRSATTIQEAQTAIAALLGVTDLAAAVLESTVTP